VYSTKTTEKKADKERNGVFCIGSRCHLCDGNLGDGTVLSTFDNKPVHHRCQVREEKRLMEEGLRRDFEKQCGTQCSEDLKQRCKTDPEVKKKCFHHYSNWWKKQELEKRDEKKK